MFTSKSQPFCRTCGKPIPKVTRTVYLKEKLSDYERGVHSWSRYIETPPITTKEQAQRLTNGKVTAVRRWKDSIHYFTEWDGETYKDPYFCSGSCATKLAYICARAGRCTTAYNEALERQRTLT